MFLETEGSSPYTYCLDLIPTNPQIIFTSTPWLHFQTQVALLCTNLSLRGKANVYTTEPPSNMKKRKKPEEKINLAPETGRKWKKYSKSPFVPRPQIKRPSCWIDLKSASVMGPQTDRPSCQMDLKLGIIPDHKFKLTFVSESNLGRSSCRTSNWPHAHQIGPRAGL